jgi:hypothetical protein
MKKIIILCAWLFITADAIAQQENTQTPVIKKDTGVSELYLVLNDPDAIDFTFNLYLNNHQITDIKNGTRMIYRIHSTGKVKISDKGHKPFFEILAEPGHKYYFEIEKKFGGRFFHLHSFSTEADIQDYMHFIFWNRNINSIGGKSLIAEILDKKTDDYLRNCFDLLNRNSIVSKDVYNYMTIS